MASPQGISATTIALPSKFSGIIKSSFYAAAVQIVPVK
tara:strand:- start:5389 stop:5502 length:114 start_codon:yes stop_codon:yes gene_type:complete